MRRLFALSAGALALAGACATSSGTFASARTGATPERPSSPTVSEHDSIIAQAIADHEGPRVDIRAEVDQVSLSRRIRAAFHVEDDSYVLIGQVDGSGTVRIVFPTDPHDDGFVSGGKRYETPEFFAGFTDEFHYRYTSYYQRYYGLRPDAYDGTMGYLFIVASWRPMHFEKFSTNGEWDSFDLADEASMRDPKPAIYELASLLAGENREAYTVKFATYYNTLDYTPGFRNASAYGLCSGYGSMGWSNLGFFNPFGVVGLLASQPMYTYGYDFTYRGTRYLYNGAGDCYEVAPTFYNGNPFSIAQVPPAVPTKPRWSVDAINRKPVSPGAPHLPPGRVGPIVAQDASPGAATSPTYRQRGLLTDDDGSTIPGRRGPRAQPMDHGFTRPAIQQMVERRVRDESRDNGNDGNNGGSSGSRSAFRGQPSEGTNRGWTSRTAESGSYNPPRVHTDASGYHGGNGASGGSAGSSGGGYSGTHAAPTGGSRTPSSSSSGGSFGGGGGGGGGASSSSSSGSAGASSSSSAGSSSGSSGGGSPIKPPKQ